VQRSKLVSERLFREAISRSLLWVAVDDVSDSPVGFILGDIVDGNIHIAEMDVHPEYGRRGIGKDLVKQVINFAAKNQFKVITLTTFKHLKWNAPFYQKLGFQRIEESECGPELLDTILEEKRIGLNNRIAMSKIVG
jgi:ribosomal protein S18 acetylase RimI-like enzyme